MVRLSTVVLAALSPLLFAVYSPGLLLSLVEYPRKMCMLLAVMLALSWALQSCSVCVAAVFLAALTAAAPRSEKGKVKWIRALMACVGIEIDQYDVREVADYYKKYPAPPPDLPPRLRGLWWMDGNGAGSDLASLHMAHWDGEQRVLTFPLYERYTFTHHPTMLFLLDIYRAYVWRWTYVFRFDKSLDNAVIHLTLWGLPFPSDSIGVKFTMHREGDTWVRKSYADPPRWYKTVERTIFGTIRPDAPEPHVYYLRRLVAEDGTVADDTMQAFTKALHRADAPTSLMQAIRK